MGSSESSSAVSPSRRRKTELDSGLLDRLSSGIVSSLQGSPDLADAQLRVRKVLEEFQIEQEETENTAARLKAEKYLSASKVLGRALHIMKEKLSESQSRFREELAASQRKLDQMEDRAKAAEHAATVLRWHLEHNGGESQTRGMGGFMRPPDIF